MNKVQTSIINKSQNVISKTKNCYSENYQIDTESKTLGSSDYSEQDLYTHYVENVKVLWNARSEFLKKFISDIVNNVKHKNSFPSKSSGESPIFSFFDASAPTRPNQQKLIQYFFLTKHGTSSNCDHYLKVQLNNSKYSDFLIFDEQRPCLNKDYSSSKSKTRNINDFENTVCANNFKNQPLPKTKKSNAFAKPNLADEDILSIKVQFNNIPVSPDIVAKDRMAFNGNIELSLPNTSQNFNQVIKNIKIEIIEYTFSDSDRCGFSIDIKNPPILQRKLAKSCTISGISGGFIDFNEISESHLNSLIKETKPNDKKSPKVMKIPFFFSANSSNKVIKNNQQTYCHAQTISKSKPRVNKIKISKGFRLHLVPSFSANEVRLLKTKGCLSKVKSITLPTNNPKSKRNKGKVDDNDESLPKVIAKINSSVFNSESIVQLYITFQNLNSKMNDQIEIHSSIYKSSNLAIPSPRMEYSLNPKPFQSISDKTVGSASNNAKEPFSNALNDNSCYKISQFLCNDELIPNFISSSNEKSSTYKIPLQFPPFEYSVETKNYSSQSSNIEHLLEVKVSTDYFADPLIFHFPIFILKPQIFTHLGLSRINSTNLSSHNSPELLLYPTSTAESVSNLDFMSLGGILGTSSNNRSPSLEAYTDSSSDFKKYSSTKKFNDESKYENLSRNPKDNFKIYSQNTERVLSEPKNKRSSFGNFVFSHELHQNHTTSAPKNIYSSPLYSPQVSNLQNSFNPHQFNIYNQSPGILNVNPNFYPLGSSIYNINPGLVNMNSNLYPQHMYFNPMAQNMYPAPHPNIYPTNPGNCYSSSQLDISNAFKNLNRFDINLKNFRSSSNSQNESSFQDYSLNKKHYDHSKMSDFKIRDRYNSNRSVGNENSFADNITQTPNFYNKQREMDLRLGQGENSGFRSETRNANDMYGFNWRFGKMPNDNKSNNEQDLKVLNEISGNTKTLVNLKKKKTIITRDGLLSYRNNDNSSNYQSSANSSQGISVNDRASYLESCSLKSSNQGDDNMQREVSCRETSSKSSYSNSGNKEFVSSNTPRYLVTSSQVQNLARKKLGSVKAKKYIEEVTSEANLKNAYSSNTSKQFSLVSQNFQCRKKPTISKRKKSKNSSQAVPDIVSKNGISSKLYREINSASDKKKLEIGSTIIRNMITNKTESLKSSNNEPKIPETELGNVSVITEKYNAGSLLNLSININPEIDLMFSKSDYLTENLSKSIFMPTNEIDEHKSRNAIENEAKSIEEISESTISSSGTFSFSNSEEVFSRLSQKPIIAPKELKNSKTKIATISKASAYSSFNNLYIHKNGRRNRNATNFNNDLEASTSTGSISNIKNYSNSVIQSIFFQSKDKIKSNKVYGSEKKRDTPSIKKSDSSFTKKIRDNISGKSSKYSSSDITSSRSKDYNSYDQSYKNDSSNSVNSNVVYSDSDSSSDENNDSSLSDPYVNFNSGFRNSKNESVSYFSSIKDKSNVKNTRNAKLSISKPQIKMETKLTSNKDFGDITTDGHYNKTKGIHESRGAGKFGFCKNIEQDPAHNDKEKNIYEHSSKTDQSVAKSHPEKHLLESQAKIGIKQKSERSNKIPNTVKPINDKQSTKSSLKRFMGKILNSKGNKKTSLINNDESKVSIDNISDIDVIDIIEIVNENISNTVNVSESEKKSYSRKSSPIMKISTIRDSKKGVYPLSLYSKKSNNILNPDPSLYHSISFDSFNKKLTDKDKYTKAGNNVDLRKKRYTLSEIDKRRNFNQTPIEMQKSKSDQTPLYTDQKNSARNARYFRSSSIGASLTQNEINIKKASMNLESSNNADFSQKINSKSHRKNFSLAENLALKDKGLAAAFSAVKAMERGDSGFSGSLNEGGNGTRLDLKVSRTPRVSSLLVEGTEKRMDNLEKRGLYKNTENIESKEKFNYDDIEDDANNETDSKIADISTFERIVNNNIVADAWNSVGFRHLNNDRGPPKYGLTNGDRYVYESGRRDKLVASKTPINAAELTSSKKMSPILSNFDANRISRGPSEVVNENFALEDFENFEGIGSAVMDMIKKSKAPLFDYDKNEHSSLEYRSRVRSLGIGSSKMSLYSKKSSIDTIEKNSFSETGSFLEQNEDPRGFEAFLRVPDKPVGKTPKVHYQSSKNIQTP
ncbi:hypothetical protein AYI69_g2940 [Smittium culicis]|uniref:Uncharacterized protein n=1 Tax=Smittium culicis TaxID=133412 RepID=A0A1R1YL06_9FUNG|nr:hypothetical protein AYI69_g2940 [Smittium culicis]